MTQLFGRAARAPMTGGQPRPFHRRLPCAPVTRKELRKLDVDARARGAVGCADGEGAAPATPLARLAGKAVLEEAAQDLGSHPPRA